MKRRELLRHFGMAVAAPLLSSLPRREIPLPSRAGIRFGYAAITWEGNDEQAIVDIASLGFRGIQLRSNTVPKYGDRPAVLRELLERHRLTLVALSSGNLSIDPAVEREQLALHTRHAAFVQKLGGLYLQIIDEKPRGRVLMDADYTRLGQLLTQLGRRTADLGIPLSYHHHIGSIGEYPDAIRRILDAADPRYVKFQLDTAHFQQGGGDPVQAVKEYGSRLLFLHIKDVEAPVPGGGKDSYRFVELGRGGVDFKRVFAALQEIDFSGWAIVELDRVPDPLRTPKESAMISKTYLQETLGFTI